jgi:hypothetical protein
MDVFPKFIIETDPVLGDCLIISKCTYHKDLVINRLNVKGGGCFRINHESMTCTFHGDSHDFGAASIEDIKVCIENDNVYTNPYLTHSIAAKYKFLYDNHGEIIELN